MQSRAFHVVFLVIGLPWLTGADWPSYMNGRARVGATAERLERTPVIAWVHSSPEPP